jgi:hypothetical protein
MPGSNSIPLNFLSYGLSRVVATEGLATPAAKLPEVSPLVPSGDYQPSQLESLFSVPDISGRARSNLKPDLGKDVDILIPSNFKSFQDAIFKKLQDPSGDLMVALASQSSDLPRRLQSLFQEMDLNRDLLDGGRVSSPSSA